MSFAYDITPICRGRLLQESVFLSMFASPKKIQRPSRSLRKTDNVGPARRLAGPP